MDEGTKGETTDEEIPSETTVEKMPREVENRNLQRFGRLLKGLTLLLAVVSSYVVGAALGFTESGDLRMGTPVLTSDEGSIDLVNGVSEETRVVVVGSTITWVALAWFGFVNFKRIFRSARVGNPFDPTNVVRLRRIGFAVFLVPVVDFIAARLLNSTLSWTSVRASTQINVLAWVIFGTIGMALFALAEVFRVGTRLRELEQTTI